MTDRLIVRRGYISICNCVYVYLIVSELKQNLVYIVVSFHSRLLKCLSIYILI